MSRTQGGCATYIIYPSETQLKPKSHGVFLKLLTFPLPNRFEIWHRSRHWHCCALCKFIKWLGKWKGCYSQSRFREILVWVEFRTNILYCTSPDFVTVVRVTENKPCVFRMIILTTQLHKHTGLDQWHHCVCRFPGPKCARTSTGALLSEYKVRRDIF